ncbi:MAG: hypothetical protein R2941_23950 [Desulfobacterales bacterium]
MKKISLLTIIFLSAFAPDSPAASLFLHIPDGESGRRVLAGDRV